MWPDYFRTSLFPFKFFYTVPVVAVISLRGDVLGATTCSQLETTFIFLPLMLILIPE